MTSRGKESYLLITGATYTGESLGQKNDIPRPRWVNSGLGCLSRGDQYYLYFLTKKGVVIGKRIDESLDILDSSDVTHVNCKQYTPIRKFYLRLLIV